MRGRLVLGIINVLLGLACVVMCIIRNKTENIIYAFFTVIIGLGMITGYISDKKQDKKRLAELAKKWGIKDE